MDQNLKEFMWQLYCDLTALIFDLDHSEANIDAYTIRDNLVWFLIYGEVKEDIHENDSEE